MSLFSILNMSGSALQAQQVGLQVTANNIANAGTDGYHRQSVDYRTAGSYWTSGLLLGSGVTAADVASAYDKFTESRLFEEHSHQGYTEEMNAAYEVLQSLVGSVDEGSLSSRISDLFLQFDALATTPHDTNTRNLVLASAQSLATEFNRQADVLGDVASSADEAIAMGVDTANTLLRDIAAINGEIVALESGGQNASDARDERSRLVDELSGLVNVTLSEQSDGSMTVMIGGHSAVQGTTARTLDTAEDAATGNQRITLAAGALAVDVTDQISSGTLAAQVEIRDSVVPGLLADLDQLAFDMVSAINGVHEAGYDLDGNTGLQLFEGASVVSGAAAAMKLSTDVDGEPSALAAATDPTAVPGDGSNAIALGDLAETLAAGGGGHTFTQEAAAWIGQLGIDAAAVEANYAIQSAVTLSVESTWLQRSAVSLEEEAVNLIQYQDAYDAMAKVLQVTQQMLDTLMEI